jgi:hypothetical protein
MRRPRSTAPTEPVVRPPGAFMPDGSHNPEAGLPQRGAADRFVRSMVSSRNGPLFTPALAAEAIVLAKQEHAFPNHAQWASVGLNAPDDLAVWPLVWTSTAAEETVKRCGRGAGDPDGFARHWCGESWAEGKEKDCQSHGHDRGLDPDRLRDMVAGIGKPVDPEVPPC